MVSGSRSRSRSKASNRHNTLFTRCSLIYSLGRESVSVNCFTISIDQVYKLPTMAISTETEKLQEKLARLSLPLKNWKVTVGMVRSDRLPLSQLRRASPSLSQAKSSSLFLSRAFFLIVFSA
ncbi:hypothetical protein F2Q68_00024576 [Brassica cretica]|uniref:Uncharacterized protein n=1 Tax=Brassica cretica TaxID=69181 RepID=A0A8S9IG17_BRACR|nr:hypothetical protein F2Q68_00024576 [Brassica cretica]